MIASLRRIAVLCVIRCLPLAAQQPAPEDTRIPELRPESRDVVQKSVRAARSKMFDPRMRFSILDTPRPGPPGVPPPPPHTFVDLIPLPELPLEESDLAVTGEVIHVQPFLTYSRSALYTEYTIRVLDTIKPVNGGNPPSSLVVIRRGGSARLEDGRAIEWKVTGEGDAAGRGAAIFVFSGIQNRSGGLHRPENVARSSGIDPGCVPGREGESESVQVRE